MSELWRGAVVLGVPRSGTTLLRRLINGHSDICSPPETYLFGAAARFLSEQHSAGGLATGVVPGLAFSGVSEEAVHDRLRSMVFGMLDDLARRAGKSLWAEKTATDTFYARAIARLCGERCRYVLLVRHPLDVILSIEELCGRMHAYMPELHEYVQRNPSTLEAFAHAWVDINSALLEIEERMPRSCLRLRYEDLTRDHVGELTRVCEFLERPTDVRSLVEAGLADASGAGLGDWKTYDRSAVDSSSVGRGGVLDPWAMWSLAPILNPLMKRLGYEQISASEPPDSETARRIYQMGRMAAAMKAQR